MVQGKLKDILEQWIQALASVIKQAGVPSKEAKERAEKTMINIQGALIVIHGTNNKAHFQRILRDLPNLLKA